MTAIQAYYTLQSLALQYPNHELTYFNPYSNDKIPVNKIIYDELSNTIKVI